MKTASIANSKKSTLEGVNSERFRKMRARFMFISLLIAYRELTTDGYLPYTRHRRQSL
jgi:hypothetical protein